MTDVSCCDQREALRRLAIESRLTIERLRSLAAGRDLLTAHEYRAVGLLIDRLQAATGPPSTSTEEGT